MNVAALVLVLVATFIAFANGQNDVSKGIATLVGSGVSSHRRAIVWGSVWTGLGGLAAAGLATAMIAVSWWFVVVTAAMVMGSLLGGLRLTRVLAENVTRMDHREGFSANLVTAVLVGAAAIKGLPLSTTHVSTGAILGAGATRKSAIDWRTVRGLLLAWIVTVPGAAGLGMMAYGAVRVLS